MVLLVFLIVRHVFQTAILLALLIVRHVFETAVLLVLLIVRHVFQTAVLLVLLTVLESAVLLVLLRVRHVFGTAVLLVLVILVRHVIRTAILPTLLIVRHVFQTAVLLLGRAPGREGEKAPMRSEGQQQKYGINTRSYTPPVLFLSKPCVFLPRCFCKRSRSHVWLVPGSYVFAIDQKRGLECGTNFNQKTNF